MAGGADADRRRPRILVFSTHTISDPGIDLAGSRHLHYPATVYTVSVPCSSGIRPGWVLRALEQGLDGVFIASDGEECAYLPDCASRTSRIVALSQESMKKRGFEPQRLRMTALCSVCAEPFVTHMREFSQALDRLGRVPAPAA